METAAKFLLGGALVLLVLGLGALVLARLGVDRLPGTFTWRSGNVTVFAPIGLMIVVSIVATIVLIHPVSALTNALRRSGAAGSRSPPPPPALPRASRACGPA